MKIKNERMNNIGVVTSPFLLKAGIVPLSNLIDILSFFSNDIHVITGNAGADVHKENVSVHLVEHNQEKNRLVKLIKYFRSNLKIAYKLSNLSDINIWFFFMGERPLIIPLMIAKLLNKKVVFISSGMIKYTSNQKNILDIMVTKIFEPINHILSDKIVIYSDRFINDNNLKKLNEKIIFANGLFLDLEKFSIKKRICDRNNLVGYIGRFSEEKGILNFVESIPKILKGNDSIKILIAGDGPLKEKIKMQLYNKNLNNKIELINWIPHGELPDYLNKLKLIVIPSYTEAGPIIAIEAMACGTPILAKNIGLIPDIVKDGETGFILENNSPECIMKNVLKIMKCSNLDEITEKGRKTVELEFTYEAAVERFRRILNIEKVREENK